MVADGLLSSSKKRTLLYLLAVAVLPGNVAMLLQSMATFEREKLLFVKDSTAEGGSATADYKQQHDNFWCVFWSGVGNKSRHPAIAVAQSNR